MFTKPVGMLLAALCLAGCATPSELPSPRSSECGEVRSVAGSRSADTGGASTPEAAADGLAASADIPAHPAWTRSAEASDRVELSAGPLWVLTVRDDSGSWRAEQLQQCLRRA